MSEKIRKKSLATQVAPSEMRRGTAFRAKLDHMRELLEKRCQGNSGTHIDVPRVGFATREVLDARACMAIDHVREFLGL